MIRIIFISIGLLLFGVSCSKKDTDYRTYNSADSTTSEMTATDSSSAGKDSVSAQSGKVRDTAASRAGSAR